MSMLRLRAQDASGKVVGYRLHNRIIFDRHKATTYLQACAARVGLVSARKNWPQYQWEAVDRNEQVVDLGPLVQQRFTREEVWALVLKERAGCAAICNDEERIRTTAGQHHPEDSEERGRCFAGARAALNCALGIRSERPTTLKDLECESNPSTL